MTSETPSKKELKKCDNPNCHQYIPLDKSYCDNGCYCDHEMQKLFSEEYKEMKLY